jgi:hypothetical protein
MFFFLRHHILWLVIYIPLSEKFNPRFLEQNKVNGLETRMLPQAVRELVPSA